MLDIQYLKLIDLVGQDDNPNEMSAGKFNRLVASIEKDGFDEPIKVTPRDGKYVIVSGHHRVKAAEIVGLDNVPAVILDLDDMKMKAKLVKDNILRGEINPKKFVELYNSMLEDVQADVLQEMMGFEDDKEFEKMYQEVRQGLSPDLQKKLDESQKEIRTIDDLSKVLNKLFNEHGETVPLNYIVFSFGGAKHIWVSTDKPLWDLMMKISNEAEKDQIDINDILLERLSED